MQFKPLKILLISLSAMTHTVSADQKDLNLEPLAMANIRCAGFYTAALMVVKPEAKKAYESSFNTHYALSHQLSASYEALAENLNKEIQRHATEVSAFKEKAQVVDFLSKNFIKCSSIEAHSAALIKNNTLHPE
ncbi:hypothetical protein ACMSI6_09920 [Pseudomonas antarctica]|uniref:hypothetical protein n=1 Tax=Pseudomonas antarctica TaxID=219572 RepID=UPI0039C32E25